MPWSKESGGEASVVAVVRHGETEWNAKGWIQGHADVGLSETGRQQAEALARRLASERPGSLASSDLRRAAETAQAVGRATGLVAVLDPGLREQCLGEWEGLHFRDVAERYPDDARRFLARESGFRPPGGETREELRDRVLAALERHAPAAGAAPALLVAHGGVIQALLYSVLLLPASSPRRFLLPNTGITTFERRRGDWFVSRMNDTAHLPGAGATFPFE